MTDAQQRAAAKLFAQTWKGRGYEKGESQVFWLSLLRDVFGVEHPEDLITFEEQVHLDHTSFIDGTIPATKVLIEQKGLGKDLNKPIKQSDGSLLNPFQQAKRYITELPLSQHPRWVVTCNFAEFRVYDMEHPGGEPEVILLENLEREYYRLRFLVDTGSEHLKRETEVSLKAGEIVGVLYDALLRQYKDPSAPETLRSLNALCVRLVFCLYAEDAGIFGARGMFHDYLRDVPAAGIRKALVELFKILDQRPEERDKYLADDNPKLAAFPYVNGGLFADETVEVPPFTEELKALLLAKASEDFDWSAISPTIFGAVFESTLNPETRRSGGMHYTSIENIHKVIDPLFLDGLRRELEEIREIKVEKTKIAAARAAQLRYAKLMFLDPACGSGNFLTETYISLRRLENELLGIIHRDQIVMDMNDPIRVSIDQFYGIEINDFAVTVAKTALWIAESQMMRETEDVVHMSLEFLPLKTNAHIVEGNALRLNWEEIVPKEKLSYIMGNPPFVGAMWSKGSQRDDIVQIFPECKKPGEIDYVAGWYVKAAKYIRKTGIRCAFVSTNSICQGQQVSLVWEPLFREFDIKIDFGYRTFRWDSEASLKAHVHCIIVGFSYRDVPSEKYIFNDGTKLQVKHINGYLADADDIFIIANKKQISGMPQMHMGSMARDGGYLIMDEAEYQEYCKNEPQGMRFVHQYMMGKELINRIPRYCFWLLGVDPSAIRRCPLLLQRIEEVRKHRLNSPAKETQALADTPMIFAQLAQPKSRFIAFPKVSSQRRKYIPIGFLNEDIIVGDKIYVIEDVGIYHFGILTSNVHNAWMRAVCGRLKSDYSYSNTIVYNNFPWPTPTEAQREKIEETAQAILDARALYPEASLADLYDELTMPPELRRAHQENDRAVMDAYGFVKGTPARTSESACVAELMRMYQKLTEQ